MGEQKECAPGGEWNYHNGFLASQLVWDGFPFFFVVTFKRDKLHPYFPTRKPSLLLPFHWYQASHLHAHFLALSSWVFLFLPCFPCEWRGLKRCWWTRGRRGPSREAETSGSALGSARHSSHFTPEPPAPVPVRVCHRGACQPAAHASGSGTLYGICDK